MFTLGVRGHIEVNGKCEKKQTKYIFFICQKKCGISLKIFTQKWNISKNTALMN